MSINSFGQWGVRSGEETAIRLGRIMDYQAQHLHGQATKTATNPIVDTGKHTLGTDEWVSLRNQSSTKPQKPFVTTRGVAIPPGSLKDIVGTTETSPAKIARVESIEGKFPNGIYRDGELVHKDTVRDILDIADGKKTYPT